MQTSCVPLRLRSSAHEGKGGGVDKNAIMMLKAYEAV